MGEQQQRRQDAGRGGEGDGGGIPGLQREDTRERQKRQQQQYANDLQQQMQGQQRQREEKRNLERGLNADGSPPRARGSPRGGGQERPDAKQQYAEDLRRQMGEQQRRKDAGRGGESAGVRVDIECARCAHPQRPQAE